MPRMARVVYKDNPHHITQRGNYRQKIFNKPEDYKNYLTWLKEYSQKYKLEILSYCLMPNHVHFIAVPREDDSLAKTFKACHVKYSQYFNKKKKQSGHLWQGRFYSTVLDEKYLYHAIKYVENNPCKANLAKNAEDWEYSSAKKHLNDRNDIKDYLNIDDWKKYLRETIDDKILKEIKSNTLTGRPSGSENFISKLEIVFGKRLKALSEGRPKKLLETSVCP